MSAWLPPKECDVEGCTKTARSKTAAYCEMHYCRIRRHGTLETLHRTGCLVDGCEKPHDALGYCSTHLSRVRRRGDANFEYVGPNNHNWTGDAASYGAVHQRLRKARGPARNHPCVDCGEPARHWSWNRDGGVDDSVHPYGLNFDGFVPRCVKCHKRFDLACLGKAVS